MNSTTFSSIFFYSITLMFLSCANKKINAIDDNISNTNIIPHFLTELSNESKIQGRVISEDGTPVWGATIQLKNSTTLLNICSTNENGFFELKNVPEGNYSISVLSIGFKKLDVPNIFKAENSILILDEFILLKDTQHIEPTILRKPIIYIYPEVATEVTIQLNYDGILKYTYPKYSVDGWHVTAHPDGKLVDKNKKKYYGLFWEGIPNTPIYVNNGCIIEGEKTTDFLEKTLPLLGLNWRETNEFIIYWLPYLEENKYNLIHFATEEYEKSAQLIITPQPETLIRIMMVAIPLENEITIPKQDHTKLYKQRKGYTVIEWGGTIKDSSFLQLN